LDEVPRLTDEQRRVFLDRNYGVVATIRRDGSPQLTTVWVDADEEDVLFNIAETRKKLRNLERDPRATVHVQDGDDPYRWLSVTGTVELSREGAEEHIHKLSRKYRGRDFTLRPGEQRVLARLTPERVVAYGLDS
jgi:PPOX class probable F420-dependent enzyme